ncbi:MAG TPA: GNAT family protein [Hyphomicrobiaceae bacterium]|jgi:[ribosomal protein S5]-alanine N-acetyltransferase|nr:GNAT family protein [Hyphomicrobiaceae bacterium]
MAFLRSTSAIDADAEVYGRQVMLRFPLMGDYSAWAELRALSRQHLTPWEPQWSRDELTRSAFRRRLRQYQREQKEDLGYAFLIFRQSDAELLGGLSISNVRRGVAQAAAVGYWIGATHTGCGYMTDAVMAMLPYAFDTLGLHRLEAACLPHNAASSRVLLKAGFRREGMARRYLRINGVWQDHDLFAMLQDDART